MKTEHTKDEQDIILKLVQFNTRNFYIMRTLPISGKKIVDEDDDLFELVSRYIYGNNFV